MKGGHISMQAAGGLYQLPTWQLGHWLSKLALHQWLSLLLLEWRHLVRVAGNWEFRLGHARWGVHSCAHQQWCQSEFSHAHLCARIQTGHATNYRAGSHPEPIWQSNSISMDRQMPDGTFRFHPHSHPDSRAASLWQTAGHFCFRWPNRFSAQIPVILSTPTINWVVKTMKESEFNTAPMEWQSAWVAHKWAMPCHIGY